MRWGLEKATDSCYPYIIQDKHHPGHRTDPQSLSCQSLVPLAQFLFVAVVLAASEWRFALFCFRHGWLLQSPEGLGYRCASPSHLSRASRPLVTPIAPFISQPSLSHLRSSSSERPSQKKCKHNSVHQACWSFRVLLHASSSTPPL